MSNCSRLLDALTKKVTSFNYKKETKKSKAATLKTKLGSTGTFSSEKAAKQLVKSDIYKRKSLQLEGKYAMGAIGVLAFVWVAIFIFSFLGILLRIESQNNFLNDQIKQYLKFLEIYVDLDIQLWGIDEYVAMNRTTKILNKPIKEEMERLYSKTIGVQTVFRTLLKGFKPGTPEYQKAEILTSGDICTIEEIGNSPVPIPCKSAAKASTRFGLTGLIGFLMSYVKQAKDYYDDSNFTFADQKKALNIDIGPEAEMMSLFYLFSTFHMFELLVKARVMQDIDDAPLVIRKLIIGLIFLFVVFGIGIWLIIWRKMHKEKYGWRKMMRNVPFVLVFSSKWLRNYLNKNSHVRVENITLSDYM